MANSMGSVMMNWTSVLVKQSKKKHRRKLKEDFRRKVEDEEKERRIDEAPATCLDCDSNRDAAKRLSDELSTLEESKTEVEKKLMATEGVLAGNMDREAKLRDANERLGLDLAQARYEIEEGKKSAKDQLTKRDLDHEQQVQMMEQMMSEKEQEWTHKHEQLQHELHATLHSSYEQATVASMSRAELERELSSLASVVEMKTGEARSLREEVEGLRRRLEAAYHTERELDKARQRVEEMNLVVENKMVAEKELMDLTESLTNDLSAARNEIIALRRELENRQYLRANQMASQMASSYDGDVSSSGYDSPSLADRRPHNQVGHRNQHQKLWW